MSTTTSCTIADLTPMVIAVVAGYLGIESSRLKAETSLQSEFGLDSTEMVCIAVDLEKKVGFSLKGIKFSDLRTPTDVAAAIAARESSLAVS